jgi:hypothetical protein
VFFFVDIFVPRGVIFPKEFSPRISVFLKDVLAQFSEHRNYFWASRQGQERDNLPPPQPLEGMKGLKQRIICMFLIELFISTRLISKFLAAISCASISLICPALLFGLPTW